MYFEMFWVDFPGRKSYLVIIPGRKSHLVKAFKTTVIACFLVHHINENAFPFLIKIGCGLYVVIVILDDGNGLPSSSIETILKTSTLKVRNEC